MKKAFTTLVISMILVTAGFLVGNTVSAATMSVSPGAISVETNKTFTLNVYVLSPDESINAISGNLSFNKDRLEVSSVSLSGSIFNFWVREPSYSNSSGSISFEGVVLNPGFQGKSGKAFTVTFKAKSAGTASVSWSSASILANDGKGTNVLRGTSGSSVTVKAPAAAEQKKPETVEKPAAPAKETAKEEEKKDENKLAPVIESETSPQPDSWSATTTQRFQWKLPKGVTAVNLLLDDKPGSSPLISYSPPITEKEIANIDDGIWYLHASFRYASGQSSVTHRPVKIDTEKPDQLTVSEISGSDNPAVRSFMIKAEDSLSGIDHYDISIDQGQPSRWEGIDGDIYSTPELTTGEHTIVVAAFDRAGNSVSTEKQFSLESSDAPRILNFPHRATDNDLIYIAGIAEKNSNVQILLTTKSGMEMKYAVPSDEEGNFRLVLDRPRAGSYSFYAQTLGSNGEKSAPSPVKTFVVGCASDHIMNAILGIAPSLSTDEEDVCGYFVSNDFFKYAPWVTGIILIILLICPWYFLWRAHNKHSKGALDMLNSVETAVSGAVNDIGAELRMNAIKNLPIERKTLSTSYESLAEASEAISAWKSRNNKIIMVKPLFKKRKDDEKETDKK